MSFDPKDYRIAFLGTPEFAVPALKELAASGYDLAAIYTNPDKPRGRSRELLPSPVKAAALELGIPAAQIHQPDKFSATEAEHLKKLNLAAAIVVAYGHILPEEILNIPRLGFLNIHASLLPRWRGAAPIQAAIAGGDLQTGVTLMRIEPALDTGPIYAQAEIDLRGTETSPELFDSLSKLGAELLLQQLPQILTEKLRPLPQSKKGITLAPQIKKRESLIDWQEPAEVIERKFRAYQPWPGLHTFYQGKRLVVEDLHIHPGQTLKPGEVAAGENNSLAVGTPEGQVLITQIKPEGKSSMPAADFLIGHPEIIGSVL